MAGVFYLASFPFSDLELGLLKYGSWAEKFRTSGDSRGGFWQRCSLSTFFNVCFVLYISAR